MGHGYRSRTDRGVRPRLVRHPRPDALRQGIRDACETLYSGSLAWRVRLPCWIVAGGLGWLVSPWAVVPAVVLMELAWMIALQLTPSGVGTRRTAVLVALTGLLALVGFATAASLGPEATVVCGTGPLLDRAGQRVMHALGAGAIDSARGSFCTVPTATGWALADLAFVVIVVVGLMLSVASAWRRDPSLVSLPSRRRLFSRRGNGLSGPRDGA